MLDPHLAQQLVGERVKDAVGVGDLLSVASECGRDRCWQRAILYQAFVLDAPYVPPRRPQSLSDISDLRGVGSAYADLFAALPQAVDITQGQGVQRAGFIELDRAGHCMVRKSGALTVTAELKAAQIVGEL